MKYVFILMVAIVSCTALSASDVPDGFSELFDFKERPVSIGNINGQGRSTIVLSVNYDTVKLPTNNTESRDKLKAYFKRNNISSSMSEKILASLSEGVRNTELCVGKIDECIVTPEDYAFFYDYDSGLLTFFINGNELDKPLKHIEFADGYNKNTAFVNHVDIYSSAYNDAGSSFAVNNKSIQGLKYGHLTSDVTISDSTSKFYELSYDLSFADNKRLYVGRFENGVEFNSTDIVNPTKYVKQTSINIGSTSNLILNETDSKERIFYFSPGPGEIRIYRDGRIIKQLNISEGQGYLSYSELPYGRYDIDIEVVVAGQVISSERKTIYNDISNMPRVGTGDFVYSIGQFNQSRALFEHSNEGAITSEKNNSKFDDGSYGSGLYSQRFTDSWLFAVGGLISNADSVASVGSQLYLPKGGKLDMNASMYQSGAVSLDTHFTINNFSSQYEKLIHKDGSDTLAKYLMGDLDYDKISSSFFYNFDNGLNGYYTYSNGKYSEPRKSDSYIKYRVSTFGLGYSDLPFNSRVDVTFDYDHISANRTAFINFQIPFGNGFDAKVNMHDSSLGGREYSSSVAKNDFIELPNTMSSVQLASVYSDVTREYTNEFYGSASTQMDILRGGLNIYTNDRGSSGVSGSFSSSQIVTDAGVSFTSDRSDAYALIDVDVNNAQLTEGEAYGFLTLRKNNKLENKMFIYDKTQSVPVQSYESYNINVDTESVSLYNSGDQGFDGFTYPGSVVVIQPNLKPLVTFVSSFSDVFDKPVDDVLCKGLGCVDVSKVIDGVFRVTLVEGSDFSLYSGSDKCLVPNDYEDAELMNFGHNYCLPDVSPNSTVTVRTSDSGRQVELYYVGTFNNGDVLNDFIYRLNLVGSTSYERQIGSDVAVYLVIDSASLLRLSKAQQSIVDSMKLYAKTNSGMKAINQPVAMKDNVRGLKND
jgi:hypothetical protein